MISKKNIPWFQTTIHWPWEDISDPRPDPRSTNWEWNKKARKFVLIPLVPGVFYHIGIWMIPIDRNDVKIGLMDKNRGMKTKDILV